MVSGVSGSAQTPMLKFPGTTATDNLVTQDKWGSEVALFYNNYWCRFSGNATILGNASVSGEPYSAGPVTRNQT